MSPELIDLCVAALFTALIGVIVSLFKRMRTLETTVATLDTKVGPLWSQVQSRVAQELHHDDPKYAEMDHLLEELIALRISEPDRSRLRKLLTDRSTDPLVTEAEHKSAQLMLLTMDKVVIEAGSP